MNKKLKKGLVYGISGAVVAGTAAGIAIPIVLANRQTIYIDKYLPNKDTILFNKITAGEEQQKFSNDEGLEDKTLLNKTEYATAFYLYDKEQSASIHYQELFFRKSQFDELLKMFNTLSANPYKFDPTTKKVVIDHDLKFEGIKLSDAKYQEQIDFMKLTLKTGTDIEPDYDKYKELYKKLYEAIESIIDVYSKDSKFSSQESSLKTSLNNYKNFWDDSDSGIVYKINKLKSGLTTSDYENSNFYTRYPEVLEIRGKLSGSTGNWTGTGIYKKIVEIFLDERTAFIESKPTYEQGVADWINNLPKKYDGATNERDAIEAKVYSQVRSSGFARFNYKIKSDFTIKDILSGIFTEIIGTVKTDAIKAKLPSNDAAVYDSTKIGNLKLALTQKESEKSNEYVVNFDTTGFYLGTDSRDPKKIFPALDNINEIFGNRKMMEIQNAIIGFKQGKTLEEGWTIPKEIIKDMFFVRKDYDAQNKTTDLNADQYENIFKIGSDEITKELISRYSLTKDSTQNKSGNLGFTDGLSSTSMAPGFGLGMLASYDKLTNTSGHRWFSSKAITSAPTLLKDIRKAFVDAFITAGENLGIANRGGKTLDESFFIKANQNEIDAFIEALNDNQIKKYFGIEMRNLFNKGSVTTQLTDGIPQIFEVSLDAANKTGIYVFYSPEYGMHIVKINANPFAKEINNKWVIASLKPDLQRMADDGNTSASVTNYGKLFKENYIIYDQINDLLKNAEYKKYLNDNIKGYTPTEGKTIVDDVQKQITGLIKANNVDRIQKSGWEKLVTYLKNGFDKELIDPQLTMDPQKIYKAILNIGGVK